MILRSNSDDNEWTRKSLVVTSINKIRYYGFYMVNNTVAGIETSFPCRDNMAGVLVYSKDGKSTSKLLVLTFQQI